MLVERLFFAEQNALLCGEDVWLCMCGCICVVLIGDCLVEMIKLFASLLVVFGGLPALGMAQGPQRRSLAVSGARLRGWLVCDGFQTLLVSMILSAGQ